MAGGVAGTKSLGLAVLKFFVPGHLDGFEFGFVGGSGVAGKAGELGGPFVHVRETDGKRIGVREFIREGDGDVFEFVPGACRRQVWLRREVGSYYALGISAYATSSF